MGTSKSLIRRDMNELVQLYHDIQRLDKAILKFGSLGSMGIQSSLACDKIINMMIRKDNEILRFQKLKSQLSIFGEEFFRRCRDRFIDEMPLKVICDKYEIALSTYWNQFEKNEKIYEVKYGKKK